LTVPLKQLKQNSRRAAIVATHRPARERPVGTLRERMKCSASEPQLMGRLLYREGRPEPRRRPGSERTSPMAISGTTGNDIRNGTELADSMFGLSGDDELHGQGGNDLLSGDDGNDKLFGEADNDLLFGGLDVGRDSDRLDGGSGSDTVTYGQVQHGMDVDLAKGQADARDSEFRGPVDTLVSIENVTGTNKEDSLTGNSGANFLSGSGGGDALAGDGGNDKLSGDQGADGLVGGLGVDKLTGGADADRFLFESTSESGVGLGKRDVITDFQHLVDKIELNVIDAQAGTVGDQSFKFIGAASFSAEGQVRAFVEGDHTVVALNTSGLSGAESQIELTGIANVSDGDFLL
jgi:serralysin